jgi:hypothetical protein
MSEVPQLGLNIDQNVPTFSGLGPAPDVDPAAYQEMLGQIAHNESQLLTLKQGAFEQYNQMPSEQASDFQNMSNSLGNQQYINQPYALQSDLLHMIPGAAPQRDLGGMSDAKDHSPRLTRFVPDEKLDETPRLSQFVPTETSTAETPRLSQFCPDMPGLSQSFTFSAVDVESPHLSEFVPSFLSDATRDANFTSFDATPQLTGMLPYLEDGTPRLTHLVPTHMQAQSFGIAPDFSRFELEGQLPAKRFMAAPEYRPVSAGMSLFMPVVCHTFAPLRAEPRLLSSNDTPRLSSFMPAEHSRDISFTSAAFTIEPPDLQQFVPAELYTWKRDIGTAPECTPRLTQFLPQ